MDSVSVKKNVIELEERLKITFPKPYFDFLCHIKADDVFEVEGSGIGLFSYSDLEERNETYEVRTYEPNYLMIGQDGDMGYFVSTNTPNDYSIRQFGIRKFPKKLVISLLFCNFIVENQ